MKGGYQLPRSRVRDVTHTTRASSISFIEHLQRDFLLVDSSGPA